MTSDSYLSISLKDIPPQFEFKDGKLYLRDSCAKPITLTFPLVLDEELARISAMLLDGCIYSNLAGLMFCQKKDKTKIQEFATVIEKKFGIKGRVSVQKPSEALVLAYGSKVLATFLHMVLDMHRTGPASTIPWWVWKSPKSVIIEYLRYAYAMEGSVRNFTKSNEVRFHSCDQLYMFDLQNLLNYYFGIVAKVTKYYVRGYGLKFYLTFEKAEYVKIFYNEIGFALESHQLRLKQIIDHIGLNSTKSRTHARTNEKQILDFLQSNGVSYREEIAHELVIHSATVRDVLKRLLAKGEIRLAETDKFQRKLFCLKEKEGQSFLAIPDSGGKRIKGPSTLKNLL